MKNTIRRVTGLAMIVAGTIGMVKDTKELINITKKHNENKTKLEDFRIKANEALAIERNAQDKF